MSVFFYIIIFLYVSLLIIFLIAQSKIPDVKIDVNPQNYQKFSIVIPFKNEAKNLPALLKSLEKINYPKDSFEIIFIDDLSTDKGAKIIKDNKNLPINLIKNTRKSQSPKKDALEKAIKIAKFDFIITTDADCIIPENWLLAYNQIIQEKSPKMIIAPVTYVDKQDFFTQFQTIEFITLQGFTRAGVGFKKPFLSNGANFGFDKQSFFEVNAYEGNNDLASGDDTFLLEKFNKKYADKILFLNTREALVRTYAQRTLKDFINQKIRWASKSKKHLWTFSSLIGLLIMLANYVTVILWILFFNIEFDLKILIAVKIIVDVIFVLITNRFYKNKLSFLWLLLSSLLYPLYVSMLLLFSFYGKYEWKNNKYKL